jgi:3-oxo-5-alpha-steroid 4-dehydrogenase 1
MENLHETFNIFLIAMSITALIVFIALFFVTAGYGKFTTAKWGASVNNKIGWVLMESPVFIAMLLLWFFSPRRFMIAPFIMFLLFETHYFHRSFIFPLLLKGKSKMPVSIISMGVTFNLLNAIMQGGWLLYLSAPDRYPSSWLYSPQFIAGTILFICGMLINMQSDRIIRNLRKPGDTAHYLPHGGMYNYVTSANYFGEILEWTGFAILTWSAAGAVFAWWTFANLVPRSAEIYKKYCSDFPGQVKEQNLKRIFPFIW